MVTCPVCHNTNEAQAGACIICGRPLQGGGGLRQALGRLIGRPRQGDRPPVKRDPVSLLTALIGQRFMPREQILETIEEALASAFKRDNPDMGANTSVKLDPATGQVSLHTLKTVVESVEDPDRQISLADARQIRPGVGLGDEVTTTEPLPGKVSAGAVQTAKRVVLQRLREAEGERKNV